MQSLDWIRLVQEQGETAGQVALADCPRAREALPLTAPQQPIAWQVRGWLEPQAADPARTRRIALTLDASVTLTCQRCLKPLAHRLHEELEFFLSDTPPTPLPQAAEDWQEPAEPLHVRQDLLELLDEQLVLALPWAARHANCNPPSVAPVRLPSAFDTLATLRSKLKQTPDEHDAGTRAEDDGAQ